MPLPPVQPVPEPDPVEAQNVVIEVQVPEAQAADVPEVEVIVAEDEEHPLDDPVDSEAEVESEGGEDLLQETLLILRMNQ